MLIKLNKKQKAQLWSRQNCLFTMKCVFTNKKFACHPQGRNIWFSKQQAYSTHPPTYFLYLLVMLLLAYRLLCLFYLELRQRIALWIIILFSMLWEILVVRNILKSRRCIYFIKGDASWKIWFCLWVFSLRYDIHLHLLGM